MLVGMAPDQMNEAWKTRLKKLGLSRTRVRKPDGGAERPSVRASTRPAGMRGEALAAEHLERLGVRFLARNYRAPGGEIDLIGESEGVLLFIEVKWRRSEECGNAAEAVTSLKRRRLVRTARTWLSENAGSSNRPVRFDVVAIHEEPFRIEWIEGAFDATS
jgi:putative endonuclease